MSVAHGSFFGSTTRYYESGGFVVVEAAYEPHLRIARHAHQRSFLSFVVGGSYVERYRHGSRTCGVGVVIYHPLGEAHEDAFSASGGRVLSVEIPDRDSRGMGVIKRRSAA